VSGTSFLVDTNILIYLQNGIPSIEQYLNAEFFISDITVLEYLGVKGLSVAQISARKMVIEACHIINFNTTIRDAAIELKQQYNVKIPDAIIAATALVNRKVLLTADKDFKKIKEITLLLIEP
jgi:predicted nucleic acid-binding protein